MIYRDLLKNLETESLSFLQRGKMVLHSFSKKMHYWTVSALAASTVTYHLHWSWENWLAQPPNMFPINQMSPAFPMKRMHLKRWLRIVYKHINPFFIRGTSCHQMQILRLLFWQILQMCKQILKRILFQAMYGNAVSLWPVNHYKHYKLHAINNPGSD